MKINTSQYFDNALSISYAGDRLTLSSVMWVSIWFGFYGLNIDIRPYFQVTFVNLHDYM